jgi:hypothetical protein
MRHLAPAAPLACLLLLAAACDGGGSGGAGGGAGSGGDGGAAAQGGAGGSSGGAGGSSPATTVSIVGWDLATLATTDADYLDRRAAVGAVVVQLVPDLAVLLDVGSASVLQQLDATDLAGAYPHQEFVTGNATTGFGVLSKVPVDGVVSHKDDVFEQEGVPAPSYQFAHDALEVHVTIGGRHVAILGVRLRTNGMPDDPDKRLAEAQHARAIAEGLAMADPTALVVVLGDFQDDGAPASALSANGWFDAAQLVPAADRFTFMGLLYDHHFSKTQAQSATIPHTGQVFVASPHAPIAATHAL